MSYLLQLTANSSLCVSQTFPVYSPIESRASHCLSITLPRLFYARVAAVSNSTEFAGVHTYSRVVKFYKHTRTIILHKLSAQKKEVWSRCRLEE